MTSKPKDITSTARQTLTCTITGLDEKHPVTVTWRDTNGAVVADDEDYDLNAGSVSSGKQDAVLTINEVKMSTFATLSSITYKCSVKSTQYSGMAASNPATDVVANLRILSERILVL